MPEIDPQQRYTALPSVRGLILGQTRRGDAVDLTALRQWLRLNAERFMAQKVDLWEPSATAARVLPLLEEARHLDVRLSLRTAAVDPVAPCTDPYKTTGGTPVPPFPAGPLADFQAAGLFDVLLCPTSLAEEPLRAWADACDACGLPLRVELHGGLLQAPPGAGFVAALRRAKVVGLTLHDPFAPAGTFPPPPYPAACLESMIELARELRGQGPEVHLMDVPFCRVPEELWDGVSNMPQRLAHHQHYHPEALAFARQMAALTPSRVQQAVEITLGQGASFHNLIDSTVLPWILEKPRWFFWLWFLHKLTRRLPLRQGKTAPLPEGVAEWEQALANHRAEQQRALGPICAACRLHPICDGHTETFKQAFPGVPVMAVPGEPCPSPLAFRAGETAWYDAIDAERRTLPERQQQLAEDALRITTQRPPTREIAAEDYEIQDHATHHMPASVRWFSFSTAELQSTVLARLSPPFTLSLTFGGGIADRIGFSFGRHARILCPMTAYSHKLTLHVDEKGFYVLLRDGNPVIPAALHHAGRIPERLGSLVEPRIAILNIDGQIVTQTVLLWESAGGATPAPKPARHTAVVVCTRFARRLQAVLQSLAHQQDLAPGALEIIVGFVPGIDATDDVLDSLQAAHPDLRIARVPFAPDKARAKGFMVNECTALAAGAWVTLLDADILLPPDYFTRLDALDDSASFAAPDGRHMLDAETTARILLGDIRPWERYTTVQAEAAEYRHRESDGVPPGFCQSVRRAVLERVRYEELDHFEGSDWWFSKRVTEQFGTETRLEGMGVLHLDHGGSQWYGTGKQR